MSTYQERQAKAARKKRAAKAKAIRAERQETIGKIKIVSTSDALANFHVDKNVATIPSLNSRVGNTYKKKTYTSNHTIAPAYNKGAYQVISKQNIKDIGR